MYGGNFIRSSRQRLNVVSPHCFIPAGSGGGRRRGIALVNVGSLASLLISPAGQPQPSSQINWRGSTSPSNTNLSQTSPASLWKLGWSSTPLELQYNLGLLTLDMQLAHTSVGSIASSRDISSTSSRSPITLSQNRMVHTSSSTPISWTHFSLSDKS